MYYKREDQDRWLGPGKVIFQDGKVVFILHGGVFIRVSPNRLIKAGEEILGSSGKGASRGDEFKEPSQIHQPSHMNDSEEALSEVIQLQPSTELEVSTPSTEIDAVPTGTNR